ncbi:family 20 glycosylhydrolase [Candidatus Latescibacterota bacterium]
MIIGCLSGSGRGTAIDGTYAFCGPGRAAPLAPDLESDRAGGGGPFSFSQGVLTDGDADTQVGWGSATVGEVGVDIVIQLGGCHFVDRVLLHQPAPKGTPAQGPSAAAAVAAGDIESIGHVEPAGLSRVEVYVAGPDSQGLSLVGHAGERGTATFPAGPITVCAGVEAEEVIVRLISYQRDIRLTGLEVWGAGRGEPLVFPVPMEMELLPGPEAVLEGSWSIAVGPSAPEDARFAASLLVEKLDERFGLGLTVSEDAAVGPMQVIVVARPEAIGPAAAALPATADQAEAYAMRVDAAAAAVAAGDRRGLVYGVEALLQLLEESEGGVSAPACLVVDAPRLAFRGAHLFLPARDQIEYTKRLIRYLLVPMRLNTIFLELAGAMRFDRRPEIAEAWERQNRLAAMGEAPAVPHGEVGGGGCLTKAEVRDLVEYARSYGIEVIPEIQSHSHVQYLTMVYPEIAEAPKEDGYPDSYCPLHPDSRRIIFDLIDEVVELLGPLRYIHMGHDEIYTMAQCPRCKGTSRDELFAHDVNEIHAYLKGRGVGMMIWADMLQPWQSYSGTEAASMIPKDIVMLEFVWYFRPWADTEDHLLQNGFQVIYGNCYSSHFTRYERRTTKAGVIGAQVSVWSGTNEEEMGRLGKIYDLAYSANTAWSDHCQEELRWVYDRRLAELLPEIRSRLRGEVPRSAHQAAASRSVDLEAVYSATRRAAVGEYGAYDLTSLPSGTLTWRDMPFLFGDGAILVEPGGTRGGRYPAEVTVPVEGAAQAVVFAHTSVGVGRVPEPFGPRQVIGQYVVEYADGSCEVVDVAFGHHLAEWNRRHGAPLGPTFHRHAGYVATWPVDPLWQGKTAAGDDVTVYAMEWTNPHPDRELRSIRIAASDPDAEVALMVLGITVVGVPG